MQKDLMLAAFISLFTGLFIYAWITTRENIRHFHATNLICWLLIALFPVLIIFSFFPQNEITGEILGFSFGGSIAAFIFIWWYGPKSALQASKLDKLTREVNNLKRILHEKELRLEQLESGTDLMVNRGSPLMTTEIFNYRIKGTRNKCISLITGNLQEVKCVDIWVNSENTNMQMSRFHEKTISGLIRYLGAKKDDLNFVIDDTIYDELKKSLVNRVHVPPATVIITSSGALEETHNVKKIFHVASVEGQTGQGYRPIRNIDRCIHNALSKADSDKAVKELNLQSILFPLLGTGSAKGNKEEIISGLILATVSYMQNNQKSVINQIFFLTPTDLQLELCKSFLDNCTMIES